jgi:hypothetical protein
MASMKVQACLTLPFFTISVEGMPVRFPWRRPKGRFLTVRDGSVVSCREMIAGVVSGLPPEAEAWLIVRPGQEAGYWPQCGLPAGQASFQAPAHFGGSETEDIGEEFGLLLTLASKEASNIFRISQAKESSRGLRELPEGTRTLDEVRVIRR